MAQLLVEHSRGSGLGHLQQQDVSSMSIYHICQALLMSSRALCNKYPEAGLRVCVTGDAPDVYEDALLDVATANDGSFQPTLLLVGTRLGINGVTPAYWEALKASFEMGQCVGIAG